jgi:hypothetical protein
MKPKKFRRSRRARRFEMNAGRAQNLSIARTISPNENNETYIAPISTTARCSRFAEPNRMRKASGNAITAIVITLIRSARNVAATRAVHDTVSSERPLELSSRFSYAGLGLIWSDLELNVA